MKNKKEILISFLLGILFIYFLNYLPTLESVSQCKSLGFIGGVLCFLSSENDLFNLYYIVSTTCISLIIYKIRNMHIKSRKDTIVISIFLAIVIVIGKAYTSSYTLYVLFSSFYNTIMTIISFLTYLVIFNYIVKWLLTCIENFKLKVEKTNKVIDYLFYKDPLFMCTLITFFVGLIYLVSFQLDGILLDKNWLILLYYIFVLFINALVYGYVLYIMNKINVNKTIRICTLLFFISPIIYICSVLNLESVLYYSVFLFLVTYQYYHLYYLNDCNLKRYICLFIIIIFVVMFDSSGIYVALIDLLTLLILKIKEHKKNTMFVILTMIICTFGLDLLSTNSYEMSDILAIPLGQTSRYIKYYSEDVSSTDSETLLKLFKAYNVMEIGAEYDANSLDEVKDMFIDNPTQDDIVNYFNVWLKMFLKHPFSYFDATFNSIYSYFYSNDLSFSDYTIETEVDSQYTEIFEVFKNLLCDFAEFIANFPVIGTIFTFSFHTLILFIVGIYLLFNNKEKFYSLIPLFVILFLCMLTDSNDLATFMPVLISTPLVIAIFFTNIRRGGICNEDN